MLFSSPLFLFVFLPLVLLLYYVAFRGRRAQQNNLLFLASLLFYGWGGPWFVLLMLLSIGVNFKLGLWAHRLRRQCFRTEEAVRVAVIFNLSLLFIFKYLTFSLETLSPIWGGGVVPQIVLPIGISFFTFQALSYVLDVAWGRSEVQRSPLDLGLYVAFFPQLIAGPIVKYATIAAQIKGRKSTWTDFSSGCSRFLVGLSKKVLISNQLAMMVDEIWALDDLTTPLAWLGALGYTLQIYFDFSGYSDMAIGLGKMFGFHFLENFNYPYIATSITDFWRRWHISLSSWFRDYLYIPLGGNRGSNRQLLRNLFVVWLLTGIWHGANWTFFLWGLFYFALLSLEKFLNLGKGWPKALRWLFTFLMVNFGWVLFRADNLSEAGRFLSAMFGFGAVAQNPLLPLFYLAQYGFILFCALAFATPLAPWLSKKIDGYLTAHSPRTFPLWDILYGAALTALLLAAVAFLVKGSYNPFIYFNF